MLKIPIDYKAAANFQLGTSTFIDSPWEKKTFIFQFQFQILVLFQKQSIFIDFEHLWKFW